MDNNDELQATQERDEFFRDMMDLQKILGRHDVGAIAHYLVHHTEANVSSLEYELLLAIRAKNRTFHRKSS